MSRAASSSSARGVGPEEAVRERADQRVKLVLTELLDVLRRRTCRSVSYVSPAATATFTAAWNLVAQSPSVDWKASFAAAESPAVTLSTVPSAKPRVISLRCQAQLITAVSEPGAMAGGVRQNGR